MKIQNVPENQSSIRQHKIHFYRQIAYTFIGAAIVVLAGLVYFSLSQAIITVTPSLETVMADFNILVKADKATTEEGLDAMLAIAEVEATQTGTGELLAEGEPQQATGSVTMFNTSNQDQPLVATTRLLSEEGVLFRLKSAVTVPAGGEVKVDVYADQKGKQGEIGATRFTVPGLNQARQQEVYAQSEAAMTGGTGAVYRVTPEAVTAAEEKVKDSLIALALAQLQEQGVETESFLPEATWVEVLEKKVDPEPGTDAQGFIVMMKAQVVFVVANEADLESIAQEQLFTSTSLGYELSSSDNGSFSYLLTNYDADNRLAQLRISLKGERRIGSNNPILDESNFVGQKPAQVQALLEADSGIESVSVELRPFWLRKIPRLVDHIFIDFAS